jgi:16S rRNA (adenine1518-N6/adenine1519-N6)-dimethyltransferase
MLLDALDLRVGASVWEIGPGLGAMTEGLLERGASVTAFELDPAFSQFLRETFAGNSAFRLVEGDVIKTWPSIQVEGELFLLGNLPYGIAAALLADFIEKERLFRHVVVTVQREVARRICAKPGSADYSSFSVLCSSVYKPVALRIIKSSAFYPEPRVESQGVRLELLEERKKLPSLFYPLVRSLFSSRRKTIRNTLSTFAVSVIMKSPACLLSARETAEEALSSAGISGERRPETLGIDEFAALAAFFEGIAADGI